MKTMDTDSLRLMIENGQDLMLINVLPEAQYRRCHIIESVNVPLESRDFEQRVERVAGGKKAKIVVYCAGTASDTSAKAVRRLERAGFSNVFCYQAGMLGWQESGLKTEGEDNL